MRNADRTTDAADSLEVALAEYLRAVEAGQRVDREQFLAAHATHRQELAEFIANHDRAQQFAVSLHASLSNGGMPLIQELPRGSRLGDYELEEFIARGGMGVVYKARQLSLDRWVALKMIASDVQDAQRFRDEAEAAAALDHPHIVAIYDIGSLNGLMYYSMPLIEGSDLRQRLREGPMPPRTAAEICRKLAGAVEFAHQRGVLHRDLKPGNVMFDLHDEPIITDFGLAKSLHDDSQQTRTGAVLGTPSYMAPEQASGDGKLVTTAIDVYGLGAVLYAMLTGRAPFEGSSSLQVIRKVEQDPPLAPRELQPEIPRDIEMICLKCLQKRPSDRYASARELQQDLQRFLRFEPVLARPISTLERGWRWYRRNWLIGNLAALLGLSLIVAAVGGSGLAWREYRARKLAEEAGIRERESKQLAFASLVDLHTSNGRQAQVVSRQAEAMVWYATAAQLAAGTPSLPDALVRVQRRQRFVGEPVRAAQFGEGAPESINFHPTGRYLLVRDCDHQIWIWDLQSHAPPQPIPLIRKAVVAEWSRQGAWLAAGNEAGQLRVQDMQTGQTVLSRELPQAVTALGFDPQGQWLAAAMDEQIICFPLTPADSPVNESAPHPAGRSIQLPGAANLRLVTVSPEGNYLLAANEEGGTWLVALPSDSTDLPQVTTLQPPTDVASVRRADFLPVWPRFLGEASVGAVVGDRWIQFSTADGAAQLDVPLSDSTSVAIEPSGKALLAGNVRSSRLISLPDKNEIRRFTHREVVAALDFHPNGPYVLTGCWDGRAQIGDLRDGRAIGDLQHQNRLCAVQFSPDGRFVCTAQHDGLIRLWRWQPDATTRQRIPNPAPETWAKMNAAGTAWFLAGTPQDGGDAGSNLRVLTLTPFDDPTSDPQELVLPGHLCDADFDDLDGLLLAGVRIISNGLPDRPDATTDPQPNESPTDPAGEAPRYELHFLRWPGGEPAHPPLRLPARPISVNCQAHGKLVAVLCENHQLWLVERETGAAVKQIDIPGTALGTALDRHTQVHFSPDGQWLLCFGPETPLALFHRQDHWSPVASPRPDTACVFAEFSPDSTRVVAVWDTAEVSVWDLADACEAGPRIGQNEQVFRAHFSPDGELISTAGADNFARIYRWRTGQLACQTITYRADVFDAVFSPDGRWLLTVGPTALMGIWSTRDGGFVDQIPITPTPSAEESSEHGAQLLISSSGQNMLVAGRRPAIEWIGVGELKATAVDDLAAMKTACELAASARIEHGGASPLLLQEWLELWREHVRRQSSQLELDFPNSFELLWSERADVGSPENDESAPPR